jgi:hypothetical protein
VGGTLFYLKRKGLKEVKTTGTRKSLKAGTRETTGDDAFMYTKK